MSFSFVVFCADLNKPLIDFGRLGSLLSNKSSIAKSIGISRDTIRLGLGHGLNTITDIYIDYDISVVDEANREVIDNINVR